MMKPFQQSLSVDSILIVPGLGTPYITCVGKKHGQLHDLSKVKDGQTNRNNDFHEEYHQT